MPNGTYGGVRGGVILPLLDFSKGKIPKKLICNNAKITPCKIKKMFL